jgi:Protein of unknown function (DUF3293)
MSPTQTPPNRDNLEAAYLGTDYRVEDIPTGPFTIRIGHPIAALAGLEWAFVTACNPRSVLLSDEENTRRIADLEKAVQQSGWRFYPGQGVARDGRWPAEPSFLIVGIKESDAVDLARQFGQNAIVAGRPGEPARLVWVS